MAIAGLMNRFTGNPTTKPDKDENVGKDLDLENLIDRCGRDEVFMRARKLGWHSAQIPPKWVWKSICSEIILSQPKTE